MTREEKVQLLKGVQAGKISADCLLAKYLDVELCSFAEKKRLLSNIRDIDRDHYKWPAEEIAFLEKLFEDIELRSYVQKVFVSGVHISLIHYKDKERPIAVHVYSGSVLLSDIIHTAITV